jgi:hypothetical protein
MLVQNGWDDRGNYGIPSFTGTNAIRPYGVGWDESHSLFSVTGLRLTMFVTPDPRTRSGSRQRLEPVAATRSPRR